VQARRKFYVEHDGYPMTELPDLTALKRLTSFALILRNVVVTLPAGEQPPPLGEQDLAVWRICGFQHPFSEEFWRALLRRQ